MNVGTAQTSPIVISLNELDSTAVKRIGFGGDDSEVLSTGLSSHLFESPGVDECCSIQRPLHVGQADRSLACLSPGAH
ncbi:hypothetical protein J6590_068329 [Homalodisca vitripennis]|nr:hypothetical protein J6590_068329 [Homalodisca vitripennis]